jgi:hypothetical protein
VAWLRQQIDEDKRVALRARQTPRTDWQVTQKSGTLTIDTDVESQGWKFGGGSGMWQCDDSEDDCDRYRSWAWAESEHIARHDPARVLAEVAAKREQLRICVAAMEAGEIPEHATWGDHAAGAEVARDMLAVMAQPFAGRPGWREEWAT